MRSMSIKGGSHPRFRRALTTGNAFLARMAALEIGDHGGRLDLGDALELTIMCTRAREGPYERMQDRWLDMLAADAPTVDLATARAALADGDAHRLADLLDTAGADRAAAAARRQGGIVPADAKSERTSA